MYHRISKLSLTNQPSYSVIVDSVDFKECYAYLSSLKYELTSSRHPSLYKIETTVIFESCQYSNVDTVRRISVKNPDMFDFLMMLKK